MLYLDSSVLVKLLVVEELAVLLFQTLLLYKEIVELQLLFITQQQLVEVTEHPHLMVMEVVLIVVIIVKIFYQII